jgi:hypothetical protein
LCLEITSKQQATAEAVAQNCLFLRALKLNDYAEGGSGTGPIGIKLGGRGTGPMGIAAVVLLGGSGTGPIGIKLGGRGTGPIGILASALPGGSGTGPMGIKLGGSGTGPMGIKLGGSGTGPMGIAFAVQAVTTSSARMTTFMIFNVPGRMENSPGGDNPPTTLQGKSTPIGLWNLPQKCY